MSTTRIDPDLRQVLGQIAWASGYTKRCQPYTPTEQEARDCWSKLRGIERLDWGSKLEVIWQEDVDFWTEEFGPDWQKEQAAEGDTGYLIALPGSRCSEPGDQDSVVWVPEMRAEKGGGEPAWMQLQVLLANPMVAWVEVVK